MLAAVMIIAGVFLRLLPHLPNFAPITATALFSGAYLNKRWAIAIPLLAMVISDYLLLYVSPYASPFFDFGKIHPLNAMFHSTTLYVWGSFLISGLIGITLRKNKRPALIIGASLAASLQFFLITNFGVWAGGMYDRGLDGLAQSYIMGLPFLKWTILGDLFYTTTFFAAYQLTLRNAFNNLLFNKVESKNEPSQTKPTIY